MSELTQVPLDPNVENDALVEQVKRMPAADVGANLERVSQAGLYFDYLKGMLLARALHDWKKEPGKFLERFGEETWKEWVANYYEDEYSAQKKVEDYKFMQWLIIQGMDPKLIWEIEDTDQVRQVRRHLDKIGSKDFNKAAETLEIAKSMKRNFRQWRKDQESGKDTEIKPQPMTLVQQKAWSFDQVYSALVRVIAEDKDLDATACLDLMKEKLKEARTK